MYNPLTLYTNLKIAENYLHNSPKDSILEPMCVIIRLILLNYKEIGTKLSVSNNSITYNTPSVLQGVGRTIMGDSREDLHNLYEPIDKFTQWYKRSEYDLLYSETILGLNKLIQTYSQNSTIHHTIQHYITILDGVKNSDGLGNSNEKKDTNINPIIDKLKTIWEKKEIDTICNLINLSKNNIVYIDTIENIINEKEKNVNEYITKITTKY